MTRFRLILALVVNTAIIVVGAMALAPSTASAKNAPMCNSDERCNTAVYACQFSPGDYCCPNWLPPYCQA